MSAFGVTGGDSAVSEVATQKLVAILGPARGRKVYADVLAALSMTELRTPDDLYAFAQALSQRSGIESAVGGLLCVAAVVRGATRRTP